MPDMPRRLSIGIGYDPTPGLNYSDGPGVKAVMRKVWLTVMAGGGLAAMFLPGTEVPWRSR